MTPIETMMEAVEWAPCEGEVVTDDGEPYATHRGVLSIGGFEFKVYQLNTGQRLIDAEDLERFFGM